MPHNRTPSAPLGAASGNRIVTALLFGMLVLAFAIAAPDASAKAPPLATTVVDVSVYAAPDITSDVIGAVPAGTEIELTGEAAPGFLAVYVNGGIGWIPAQFLSLSGRPGIDTATALVDTPLLEAPMRDAGVVTMVPEGASVILTGARVDGFDAASYESSGGWINDRDIAK